MGAHGPSTLVLVLVAASALLGRANSQWSVKVGGNVDGGCGSSIKDLLPPSRNVSVMAALLANSSAIHNMIPDPATTSFTLLVPQDAAFRNQTGKRANVTQILAKGLEEDKLRAWLLYSTVPQGVAPAALAVHGQVETELSVALKSKDYSIGVNLPKLTENVRISDGFGGSQVQVVDSFFVCKAWVYILDTVIWPSDFSEAEGVPSVPASKTDLSQLWGGASRPLSFVSLDGISVSGVLDNLGITVPGVNGPATGSGGCTYNYNSQGYTGSVNFPCPNGPPPRPPPPPSPPNPPSPPPPSPLPPSPLPPSPLPPSPLPPSPLPPSPPPPPRVVPAPAPLLSAPARAPIVAPAPAPNATPSFLAAILPPPPGTSPSAPGLRLNLTVLKSLPPASLPAWAQQVLDQFTGPSAPEVVEIILASPQPGPAQVIPIGVPPPVVSPAVTPLSSAILPPQVQPSQPETPPPVAASPPAPAPVEAPALQPAAALNNSVLPPAEAPTPEPVQQTAPPPAIPPVVAEVPPPVAAVPPPVAAVPPPVAAVPPPVVAEVPPPVAEVPTVAEVPPPVAEVPPPVAEVPPPVAEVPPPVAEVPPPVAEVPPPIAEVPPPVAEVPPPVAEVPPPVAELPPPPAVSPPTEMQSTDQSPAPSPPNTVTNMTLGAPSPGESAAQVTPQAPRGATAAGGSPNPPNLSANIATNSAAAPSSKSSSSLGGIIGGVVGGLAGLAAVGFLIGVCARRRMREQRRSHREYVKEIRDAAKEKRDAAKEARKELKEEHKANRKAWKEWRSGRHSGPSDLEKIVGGQSKVFASLYNMDPADSASSVTRAGNQQSALLRHPSIPGHQIPPPHTAVPVFEDSADMYANKSSGVQAWPQVEDDEWQLDPMDITITKSQGGEDIMIGQGGFGSVFLGELHSSTPVAVKVLKSSDARSREAFLNEMSILKSLHHCNIVQFLGACVLQNTVALVTEYMPEGDLWHSISADNYGALGFYKRGRSIALDIARGTIYMHSKKIIHLDLKSANILLARDGSAKIADVGLAKIMSRELTQVSARGSFDWVAPEVLRGEEINDKADIWSLSVLIWEICSGERPQNRFIRELKVPEECPQEVADLISRCRREPELRPGAKEVYEVLNMSAHTLEEASSSRRRLPQLSSAMSHRQADQLAADLQRGTSLAESGSEDRLGPLPDRSRQYPRQSRSSRGLSPGRMPPNSFPAPQQQGSPLRRLHQSLGHPEEQQVSISPFRRIEEPEQTSDENLSSADSADALLARPADRHGGHRPVGKKPSPFAAAKHQETPLSTASRSFGRARR